MPIENNKQIIRSLIEAFNQGNLGIIDNLVAPNFVGHNPQMPQPMMGPTALKGFYASIRNAIPDAAYQKISLIGEDDRVVSIMPLEGTFKKAFMGIPANGRKLSFAMNNIWRLENGKIAELWINLDSAAMMQQMTAPPASDNGLDDETIQTNITNSARYRRTQPLDRVIFNGLDLCDYIQLEKALERGENWVEVCVNLGDRAVAVAERALANGNTLTARTFFLNATALYRVGQYVIPVDVDRKVSIYRKMIDTYSRAAKLFDPPIQKVEIPFDGYTMTGWLRLPKDAGNNCPAVVSVGGADGWREEHHNYSEHFVARGIAYLMVDGPGQGETRLINKAYMPFDFEKAFDAAVNFLYKDDRVGKKIGISGWSFGGHLVAKTASYSKKLSAAAVIGGSYDPIEILKGIPIFMKVYAAMTGKDEAETAQMVKNWNMKGHAEKITCPLIVIHGKPDFIYSIEGAQRLYDEASSEDKEIHIWEDGNHCVTNHTTEVINLVADWFAEKLK
jgi:steroid delta-isomerase-like uncharacterized protein